MSLEDWNFAWEIVAAIGTIAVLFGAFLEYGLEVFAVLRQEIHPATIEVETRTKQFGSFLVVVGLAVEFVAGAGVIVTSLRLDTEHRLEIAQIRLETAKIEKEFAPRRLAPDQLAKIANAVRPFAGEHINIDTYRDVEPWFIADRIHIALTGMQGFSGAGWVGNVIAVTELDRAISGILIELTPKADSRARDAAEQLAVALRAENLVVIGPKPIWPALRMEGFGVADNEASICLTVGVNLPSVELGNPNPNLGTP
jgi:hypothetical protein